MQDGERGGDKAWDKPRHRQNWDKYRRRKMLFEKVSVGGLCLFLVLFSPGRLGRWKRRRRRRHIQNAPLGGRVLFSHLRAPRQDYHSCEYARSTSIHPAYFIYSFTFSPISSFSYILNDCLSLFLCLCIQHNYYSVARCDRLSFSVLGFFTLILVHVFLCVHVLRPFSRTDVLVFVFPRARAHVCVCVCVCLTFFSLAFLEVFSCSDLRNLCVLYSRAVVDGAFSNAE